MNLSEQLRAAVNELIYTGKIKQDGDISGRLEYSKGTVSAYLSGKTRPSGAFLKKFENVFELSLADMNGKAEDTKAPPQSFIDMKDRTEELIQSFKERIDELKQSIERTEKHNDALQSIVQSNLNAILKNQVVHDAEMLSRQDTMLRVLSKDEDDFDRIFDSVHRLEVQHLKAYDGTDNHLRMGSIYK